MEKINREQILREREKWYKFVPALFEIVKCLKNRELSFLTHKTEEGRKKAVRYLLAFKIDYLKSHFKWFNFNKNLLNMYHSVAKLEDVPVFSYNLKERRKKEDYEEFNKNYSKYIVGYNFFFDFDGGENFNECHKEAKEFKKILDDYKVPYYILNSSFNGIHFQIPEEYMPKGNISKILGKINDVLYNIKGVYDFKSLDDSVVDFKRLCKCPYSIECEGAVCLPLNDAQFENFNEEMVRVPTVLKNVRIMNRGLLTRKWGLSDENLKSNVKRFIKEHI